MINIDKAFNTENRSIYDYFVQPGVGFYIPLYQRDYSWDSNNIEQLLEDISKGIEDLSAGSMDNQIRFLGTIITVTESDKNNIQPQDTKALPPAIEKVIDGQQRLSTIALLAAILFKQVQSIKDRLTKTVKKLEENYDQDEITSEIEEACEAWKEKLKAIFGVELAGGIPKIKPKIIRGNLDKWVRKEEENTSYKSPVAYYLHQYIDHFFNNGIEPTIDRETNAGKNLKLIQQWLSNKVSEAHIDDSEFCDAQTIIDKIKEDNLWLYPRPDLIKLLKHEDYKTKNSFSYHLSALVQNFAVCHYLLERCCFTIIKPANDDWAFDMFQSLNATGTPLTAIETFKPIVVQTIIQTSEIDFKDSIESRYFQKIERSFIKLTSASQKSRLTNEILTSFALPADGEKLSTHFSAQRKWLKSVYEQIDSEKRKTEFIKFFGNYAEFYDLIWINYKGANNHPIKILETSEEADLISLLILFLKDSNHKMAITFLGTFYHNLAEGKENSASNFTMIVKAVSAFYILWRTYQSNTGLDNVYRTYFRGSTKTNIESKNWVNYTDFDVEDIKTYLKGNLPTLNKEEWLNKAQIFFGYKDSVSICRFALRNAAHDTIPDEENPGLFKTAKKGTADYLRLEKWLSEDLNSIEHIAPEKNKGDWNKDLYDNDELFNSIGNLTLLPRGVNTSASNKGWKEKLIYYKHLGEQDPDKLTDLTNKAKAEGVSLSVDNINVLKQASYADHIRHITNIMDDQEWDAKIIQTRARKILDTLWDRVITWLE